MEIQKQNSNIITAKKSSLKQILENAADDKTLARELTKFTAGLNLRKIYFAHERYTDLVDELQVLRRNWAWWNNQEEITDKKLVKTALEDIKKRGEAIKEQLQGNENPVPLYLEENDDNLIAHITTLLLDLDDSFNFNNKLTTNQIESLVYGIRMRCMNLTLEDLALCFRRAKEGDYGQVFRLDPPVIYGFLAKYKEELQDVVSDYHRNLHLVSKSGSLSYDPRQSQSVYNAKKDRGMNPLEESYYHVIRDQALEKKNVKQRRIDRKLKKSKS